MRKIKFRAWDNECADIFDWEYLQTLQVSSLFDDSGHYTLMQYTGLKDKNGVEIYEGDICLLPNGEKRFVRYDAPSFYLAKNSDLVDVYAFSTPGIYEEVIGNIYENPELLAPTKPVEENTNE